MQRTYLDNSATTKLSLKAKNAMIEAMDYFGNPSSLHEEGRKSKRIIENARKDVAKLINADSSEIIFTSGGTESNNTVLNFAAELVKGSEKNNIIVSAIEHPSILKKAEKLRESGIEVKFLSVDKNGRVNIDELKSLINHKTALVSIVLANNEIGVIQDIKKITEICHNFGALVHSDIVQAVGKINVDVQDLNLDLASISAHKINGPKGVGALFINKSVNYSPFIIGGHQESNRRSGTENIIGIAGFGAAATEAIDSIKKYEQIAELRNKLRQNIIDKVRDVKVNGDQNYTLPNILNVSFAGAEGESILLALDYCGIAVSTGSACATGDTKPSSVLMAIQANPELAHGSIRFSFGLDNTEKDTNLVMEHLPKIINNLREISTEGKN